MDNQELVIKQKFQIQLLNLEKLVQDINNLVVSEDTLEDNRVKINEFGKTVKDIEKLRVELKEPSLAEGRRVDSVAKELTKLINDALDPKIKSLQVIAKQMADKKAKQDLEDKRIEGIKTGIANNILSFSQKIGIAESTKDLIDIERIINLEKGRKEKYAEFYDDFMAKLTPVYDLIKVQKGNFETLENAKKELETTTTNNDFENLDKAEENLITAQQTVSQNSIAVQEIALETVTKVEEVVRVQPVFSTISARRTTWEFEIHDQVELLKRSIELCEVSLKKEKVKLLLNEMKENGTLNNKEEYIQGGIRYFKKVIY